MSWLFRTDSSSWPQLLVRLAVGGVMIPHGAQKLLGWFGGYGWTGTMGFLTGAVHLPAPVAALVILIESFGALAILAGFATRLSAVGVAAVMIGAVATGHWSNGFFMNWFGNQAGEGFEYHLLMLGLCAALVTGGAGRWSVDALLAPKPAEATSRATPIPPLRRAA